MIRRNKIVSLDNALDYILNRNAIQFERSDNLYSDEKENTDFDNTAASPIIEINNKMKIVKDKYMMYTIIWRYTRAFCM